MTVCASPQMSVETFDDHVDAIPMYLGSVPGDSLLVTAVPHQGPLAHRTFGRAALPHQTNLDFVTGARLVLLVALYPDRSQAAFMLTGALNSLRLVLSQCAMPVPRVSGGWVTDERIAQIKSDGTLGDQRDRPLSLFAQRALLAPLSTL